MESAKLEDLVKQLQSGAYLEDEALDIAAESLADEMFLPTLRLHSFLLA